MSDNEDHPHAKRGLNFGMVQEGILAFHVRPGRRFTEDEMGRIGPKLKTWTIRTIEALGERTGSDPVIDRDSINIWQDMAHDVVVAHFSLTMGWDPGFVCYANQRANGNDYGAGLSAEEVLKALGTTEGLMN